MKKLSIALAVAGAFAATSASAVVLGEYDQGCLVPAAIYTSSSNTVVGLTSLTASTVYWTFFDVNSNHVSDGQFTMTANDMYSYSMSAMAGALTSGTQGYLTFSAHTLGAAGTLTGSEVLACNAFYITSNDAAYIPAVNLTTSDYSGAAVANLTTLGATSIAGLSFGNGWVHDGVAANNPSVAATSIDLRYWIDGATGGRDTSVVIWTANNAAGSYTVNMYDADQNRQSVTLALANQELNIYNPEAQVGRPATFLDGFVNLGLGAVASGGSTFQSGVLSYSVVSDPAFGATQTLMNASR